MGLDNYQRGFHRGKWRVEPVVGGQGAKVVEGGKGEGGVPRQGAHPWGCSTMWQLTRVMPSGESRTEPISVRMCTAILLNIVLSTCAVDSVSICPRLSWLSS